MHQSKKILVTGGAGFIGSHTAVELYNAGYEPVLADNFSNSEPFIVDRIRELTGKDLLFYEADVNDKQSLTALFKEHVFTGVIHFAAFKAVGESVAKPLLYYKNNIGSLITLLECMKEHKVENIVFSSSCTVYGEPDIIPVTEKSATGKTTSPYGFTKVACEQLLQDTHRAQEQFNTVILRYFNPIGAHPSGRIGELPQGVPNNLLPYITQTAAGIRKELMIYGNDYDTRDGTCIRDYIHVVDLAKAHVAALRKLEENKSAGALSIYNVGTGKGYTVAEVIRAFEKVNSVSVPHKVGNRRPGDVEKIWASTALAEKELSWKAELSLEDAVRDSWNWEQKRRSG